MTLGEKARLLLRDRGHTQSWTVKRMNELWPGLNMSDAKLSATLKGFRTMTATEFLAFCRAIEINPETFMTDDAPTAQKAQ